MASTTPDPASTGDLPTINLREQLVRIDKMQAKLQKIQVEITQIKVNTSFQPWRVMIAAIASTVALFGAAAAFLKLIG